MCVQMRSLGHLLYEKRGPKTKISAKRGRGVLKHLKTASIATGNYTYICKRPERTKNGHENRARRKLTVAERQPSLYENGKQLQSCK